MEVIKPQHLVAQTFVCICHFDICNIINELQTNSFLYLIKGSNVAHEGARGLFHQQLD